MGRKNRNARTRTIPDYAIETLALPVSVPTPELSAEATLAFLPAIGFAPLVVFVLVLAVTVMGMG